MKFIPLLIAIFLFTYLPAQEIDGQDSIQTMSPEILSDSLISYQNAEVNYTIDTQLTASLQQKKKYAFESIHILIGLNYSYLNPYTVEKDNFAGSYFPVKDSAPVWTERNTSANLSKSYPVRNFQFYLQANFWKGLFIGMNYQFFTIKQYKKDPNLGNLLSKTNAMFFIVTAKFGYVFEFLKNKCLQIEPSVRIGGYTADSYYDSGKGSKFAFGADCKIRYLIKRKFGVSVGFDYDFLRYKKKGFNDIFQRDAYQKTTMNLIHLNAGICYNITIRPNKK